MLGRVSIQHLNRCLHVLSKVCSSVFAPLALDFPHNSTHSTRIYTWTPSLPFLRHSRSTTSDTITETQTAFSTQIRSALAEMHRHPPCLCLYPGKKKEEQHLMYKLYKTAPLETPWKLIVPLREKKNNTFSHPLTPFEPKQARCNCSHGYIECLDQYEKI